MPSNEEAADAAIVKAALAWQAGMSAKTYAELRTSCAVRVAMSKRSTLNQDIERLDAAIARGPADRPLYVKARAALVGGDNAE